MTNNRISLERAKYEGHHETLGKAYDEIKAIENKNKKLEHRLLLLSAVSFLSVIVNIFYMYKQW